MADSIIGALRVVLGLDTAAFSSGAKEADNILSQLEKSFTSVAKTIGGGLLAGFSVAGVVKELMGAVHAADEMNKASQKFGIGTEALSGLKYAADLADVSFESLSKGLKKLAQATTDAVTKPTSDAAAAFQTLGVSMDDIKGKTPEKVLLRVADAFSKFEDDATKTKIAVALFGRAGADLIPLLNQGATGIQHMTDEAAKLGLVVSGEAAKAAEDFNDALKALEKVVPGLANTFLQQFTPEIIRATKAMKDFIDTGDFKKFAKGMADTVKTDVQDFTLLSTTISRGADVFKNFFSLIATNTAPGEFLKRQDALIASIKNLSKAASDTKIDIDILPAARKLDEFEMAMTQAGGAAKQKLDPELLVSAEYVAKLNDTLDKQIVTLKSQTTAVGQSAGMQAQAKIIAEFLANATHLTSDEFERQSQIIYALAGNVQKYTDEIAKAGATKAMRDGLQQENAAIEAQIATLGKSAGARDFATRARMIELAIQQGKISRDEVETQGVDKLSRSNAGLKDSLQALTATRTLANQAELITADNQLLIQSATSKSAAATASQKFQTDELIKARQAGIPIDAAYLAQLNATSTAIGQQAVAQNAYQMIIASRTPTEQLAAEEVKYQEVLKQYPDLYANVQKALEQLEKKRAMMMADALATTAGGFSQLLTVIAGKNKEMFQIAKAFAIAEAVINTYKAANMALAAPPGPPFSYIYVAGAIAAGLANVIKIQAQQAPTAATGGRFSIPGAGGIDSQMVPIMMTPGEKVSVDQNKYGESGGSSRTITLQGLKPKEYYRGDVLRDFVDNLNQAIGDGLKIKLA